jgi:N-acetylmuramoyl-L-alanine amidase
VLRGRRPRVLVGAVLAVVVLAPLAVLVGGEHDPAVPAIERTAARGDAASAAAVTTPTADAATSAGTTPAADTTSATRVPTASRAATTAATETTPAVTETTTAPPAGGPATRSLSGRTIVLDPGHNGGNAAHPDRVNRPVRIGNGSKACDTTGTESVRGLAEHRFNWIVAGHARRALERAGATVVLTRADDRGVGPCITRRMPTANRIGADLAVSIHADGGPSSGRGFHVILPGRVPQIAGHDRIVAPSARLGRAVRAAFRRGTGMPYSTYLGRRGLDVRTDLGGLNLVRVPGVMVETGNMRNRTDARLMGDADWRRRAGRAIAAGVIDGLRDLDR